MPIDQNVIVLGAGLEERQRTTSKGTTSRYTVTVSGDSLVHNFDDVALGAGPAEAIRNVLRDKVRAIVAVAAPSTLANRQRAKAALQRGASWAVKRYSGGRTGTKEPGQTVRLFNDSGRFADGLFVRQNLKEKSWTINVPANRLDPSTFADGQAGLQEMYQRLVELVPEFADASKLADAPEVRRAVAESISDVLMKAGKETERLKRELIKKGLELLRQVAAPL